MDSLHRSSFSQHSLFEKCPKSWYYQYIMKIQVVSDMCNADAGTSVHKALDVYYRNGKNLEDAKKEFEVQWTKFKLSESKLKLEKDTYWCMCLNGITLQKNITSTELKIWYPDVTAYIDAVDSTADELLDWKTSKRHEENEAEYKQQLLLYSYLYQKKFGRLPRKATVYYLRYTGSKGEMSFSFTEEEVRAAEKWYYDILNKMIEYIKHPETLPPFNHNYMWSPYRNFWDTDGNGTVTFVLHIFGNHIQLEGPITELLEKGIMKKFSYELKNAHWIKKANPHARTTVEFWNKSLHTLPLGFRDSLLKTLQDYAQYKHIGLEVKIQEHRLFDSTVVEMPESFVNGKTLRDYQKEAVDVYLRKKVGILEIGTGGGKTEIAIECIRKLKCKTLFVVDKIELLRQTKKRVEESLGIQVGQIGAGEDTIKDVTVATIQTLNKRAGEFKEYLATVKFAIFDETHKVAASSYVKISRYLTGTEFRLGLSGTAFRDDGNDMMITAVTGNVIHNLSSRVLIDRGWLVKPKITFVKGFLGKEEIQRLEEECKLGLINETAKYSAYYNTFIVHNTTRNERIQQIVTENKDKKILILTKLIEHGQLLAQLLPGSRHLYGGSSKEERAEMFKEFTEGNMNILVSTIPIWSEGLDFPNLQLVINAGANSGSVKTIQMLGRVLRMIEGKKAAQYIDFWDESRFFRGASSSRRKALLREGHDVDFMAE